MSLHTLFNIIYIIRIHKAPSASAPPHGRLHVQIHLSRRWMAQQEHCNAGERVTVKWHFSARHGEIKSYIVI